MIKLLFGGSPCTHWSSAKTSGRETEPTGLGWELFKNYLIAKEKFRPDYFLYENNRSAAQSIKDQIRVELGAPLQYIDSALVSAQRRQRFYVHSIPGVSEPEDKGILLRDVLDSTQSSTPIDYKPHKDSDIVVTSSNFRCQRRDKKHSTIQGTHVTFTDSKSQTLSTAHIPMTIMPVNITVDSELTPVYVVENGFITIKGKQYPIRLPDGYYIIRKLSVTECKRLQTVPDDYIMPCSASQSYKMLGNGWTVDVIAHILSHIPNIKNEEVSVVSLYDGMACGYIALKKLGVKVKEYHAYEIDKYAIKTSNANFPDVVHHGDAFQIRDMDNLI